MKLKDKKMTKYCKKVVAVCLLVAMILTSIGSVFVNGTEASAATKKKVTLKLSKTSVTLQQGKKTTLKIRKKNVKKVKGIKWSVKDKKIAKVTKKGVVKGVKAGKTTVICKFKYQAKGTKKFKSKTLKCKVTVGKKSASQVTNKANTTQKPVETSDPGVTSTPAPDKTPDSDVTPTPDPDKTPGSDVTPTPAPGSNPTPGPNSPVIPPQVDPIEPTDFSATALEFASQLGAGINIGNSLDSYTTVEYLEENEWNPSPMKNLYLSGSAGLNLETSWECPAVTKEYIDGIKAAGFKTVRLPVSYVNHVKTETVDGKKVYTIDEQWLNRVQEIVDWVIEDGLYVIINVHHDGADDCPKVDDVLQDYLNEYGGEQSTWLSPLNNSEEAYAQMEEKFVSLWTQIATKFKDYSNYLLFADMNEFHHGYNAPEQSWLTVQNHLHQAFVDVVRSTGGNNTGRYLIVPGYNTNIDQTVSGLVLPTDIEANQTEFNGNIVGHIMTEVHYYDPYTYAGDNPADTLWGSGAGTGSASWGQEDFLQGQMEKMQTNFLAKGVPVIIGEFGAPTHNIDAATDEKYRTYYYSCVVKEAVQNGLVPIAWDNGTTFELISRDGSVAQQSIVEAIIKYAKNPSEEIEKPWK